MCCVSAFGGIAFFRFYFVYSVGSRLFEGRSDLINVMSYGFHISAQRKIVESMRQERSTLIASAPG